MQLGSGVSGKTHYSPRQQCLLTVTFQGVVWDGAAETLVGEVIGQISRTLQDQLTTMAAPGESQMQLSLGGLPQTWTSTTVATQVVILYTQLVLDHALSSSSSPSHLAAIVQELNTCILTAQQILRGRGKSGQNKPPPQTNPPPPPPPLQANPPPQTHTPSHSHTDLVDTQSDQQLVTLPSDSNVLEEGEAPQKPHISPEDMLQPYMVSRLQAIIQLLVHYRNKVQHFLGQGAEFNLGQSFVWKCTPHFVWSPLAPSSSSSSSCSLSCLQAKVPYAYRYTGTAPRIMLTTPTERCLMFLMHTIDQGSSPFLTGPEVCMRNYITCALWDSRMFACNYLHGTVNYCLS